MSIFPLGEDPYYLLSATTASANVINNSCWYTNITIAYNIWPNYACIKCDLGLVIRKYSAECQSFHFG